MKLNKISVKGMSREDWLIQRKKTIGGSEAAALVGMSKYSSPYMVWADKTNRLPEQEDNEAMRIGRDLEEYVAKRFTEATGKKVRRENYMLYNPLYPHSHADVDRMVVGENAGLECKTTNTLDIKQFKGVDFPDKYYVQCVHYMAITGADRWYLAVLVFGKGFFTYILERDQEEIDALMKAENDFWESYIENDVPPVPDGKTPTTETIKVIYDKGTQDDVVNLIGRENLLNEYISIKKQISSSKERLDEIENIIKNDLKEFTGGECRGFKVTFKNGSRKTLNSKALIEDNPNIDINDYYSVSAYRTLKITQDKEI